MSITIVDLAEARLKLLPLSHTRPVSELRVGILKITEKWEHHFPGGISHVTETHLSGKFINKRLEQTICVNGSIIPNAELVSAIQLLSLGQALIKGGLFIAAKISAAPEFGIDFWSDLDQIQYSKDISSIDRPWDVFSQNGDQIKSDFKLITEGRVSSTITDPNVIVYGQEQLFIEKGAQLKACVIDAENGPVYIGKNTTIAPGALVQGPFALCENSHVNMGAKMKRDTTIGPYCKVGGEISNSVLLGYSNKGHEGYLGNSVLGEWCNIGADTNTSNLKNNYTEIKVWGYDKQGFVKTGLQFCGLIMGDHSKCGINTMFNTGTIVGVGTNIFGAGFPRNFIPSFSWGGAAGFTTFIIKSALETAKVVMLRRHKDLDQEDEKILSHVYMVSKEYRTWEKSKAQ